MTSSIETFFDAWGEVDAGPRADKIKAAMADAFLYADPRSPGKVTDLDALIDYVGLFSANAPGWTAKVIKADDVQNHSRALVAFGGKGPDGSDMVQHGTYFAEMKDDKIARLVGFVGVANPE